MKKSQVLTALTFAFALGVVAPVVSLYVDGQSTYAVTNDSISGYINAAIDEAMMTTTDGASAYDYQTLQNTVKAAKTAEADQISRLAAQLEIEDNVLDEDGNLVKGAYDGKTVAELISIARNRAGYESNTTLQGVVQTAEGAVQNQTNQIRNCLFEKFGKNVDNIKTLDEAIAAAEGVTDYELYAELLETIDAAREVNNSDAGLNEAKEAIDDIIAAVAKIQEQGNADEGELPTNPIDPSNPDKEEPGQTTPGENKPADVNQPADGKGEEAAAPEKGGKSPNTGTTGSASGTATAVSATSTVATIATGIFTLMRHLRQGKEA